MMQELVAEKLKGYEREHKELNILLFPEVGLRMLFEGGGRNSAVP